MKGSILVRKFKAMVAPGATIEVLTCSPPPPPCVEAALLEGEVEDDVFEIEFDQPQSVHKVLVSVGTGVAGMQYTTRPEEALDERFFEPMPAHMPAGPTIIGPRVAEGAMAFYVQRPSLATKFKFTEGYINNRDATFGATSLDLGEGV